MLDSAVIVDVRNVRVGNALGRFADIGHAHAEVPFSDGVGPVALRFQKVCNRLAAFLDQRTGIAHQHARFQRAAPAVAPGQNAVAGRGAYGGYGVRVGKRHTVGGQRVKIRGAEGARGVQAGDVSVAHIVRQDVNDVRSFLHCAVLRHVGSGKIPSLRAGRREKGKTRYFMAS